jgi:hypothetical protein
MEINLMANYYSHKEKLLPLYSCGTKVIKPCLHVKSNQVLTSREKQIQFAQFCYTHSQSSHKDPKSTTKAIQDHRLVHTEHAEKQYYAYIRLHQHEYDYIVSR